MQGYKEGDIFLNRRGGVQEDLSEKVTYVQRWTSIPHKGQLVQSSAGRTGPGALEEQ